MAKIEGITIEIGADTLSYDNSLKGVRSALSALRGEAREVNNALKFDTDNIELLERQAKNYQQQLTILTLRQKELNNELAALDPSAKGYANLQNQLIATNRSIELMNSKYEQTKQRLSDIGNDSSLLNINKRLESLNLELETVNAEMRLENSDQFRLAADKAKLLESAIVENQNKLATLTDEQSRFEKGSHMWNYYETQIAKTTEEIGKHQKELGGLSSKTDTTRQQLTQLTAEADRLNKSLKFDGNNLDTLNKQARNYEQQITILISEHNRLSAELNQLDKNTPAWNNKKAEIDAVGGRIDMLNAQLGDTRKKMVEIGDEGSLLNVNKRLEVANASVERLNAEMKRHDSDTFKLSAEKAAILSTAVDDSKAKISLLIDEQAKFSRGSDMWLKYEKDIAQANSELGKMQQELAKSSKESETAGTKFKNSLKDLNDEISMTRSKLEEVNARLKLDPNNVSLTTSRMELLKTASEQTAAKLKLLKDNADNVNKSDQKGYRKEVAATEKNVVELNKEIDRTAKEANKAADKAEEAGKKMRTSFFDKVLWGAALEVGKKGLAAITSSLDSAISRFDIMKGYPSIMESLGHEASEAHKSMDKLTEGIEGLPTTLDDIVANTQRLAIATGNLDTGTEYAIAFNNAMIAGGASSEKAQNAFIQFSQALSKGSIMGAEFNSMMEASPLLMSKVAEGFGYGASGTAELREALKEGEITAVDFSNKMLELNDGVGGFADVARKSGVNLGSSIKNLKNSVVAGLGDIIQTIDESLIEQKVGSLAEIFTNMKIAVRGVFTAINETLKEAMPTIIEIFQELQPIFEQVGTIAKEVGKFMLDSILEILPHIKTLTEYISEHKALIPQLVTILLTLVAVFKTMSIIKNISKMVSGLSTALSVLANPIGLIVAAIAALTAGLIWFFTETETGKKAWADLVEKFKEFYEKVGPVLLEIWEKVTNKLKEFYDSVAPKVLEIWNKLSEKFTAFSEKIMPKVIEIFGKLSDGVKDAFTIMYGIAEPILSGLWKFITENLGTVVEIIAGIGSTLFEILSFIFETIWHIVETFILPLVKFIADHMDEISAVISFVWDIIAGIFEIALDLILFLVKKILLPIVELITDIMLAIMDVVSVIWDKITKIFTTVFEKIISIYKVILEPIVALITGDMEKIREIFETVWNAITEFFTKIGDKIGEIIDGIIEFFAKLGAKITLFGSNVISGLGEFVSDTLSKIGEFFTNIIDAVVEIFVKVVKECVDFNSRLKKRITDLFSDIVKDLGKFVKNIVRTVIDLFADIINTTKEKLSEIFDKVSNLGSDIVQTFKDLPKKIIDGLGSFVSVGVEIFNNIMNGIGDIGKAIGEKITGAVSSATSAIKDGVGGLFGKSMPVDIDAGDGNNVRTVLQSMALASNLIPNIGQAAHNFAADGYSRGVNAASVTNSSVSNSFVINVSGNQDPRAIVDQIERQLYKRFNL